MRIDSNGISTEGHKIVRVRADRIGSAADKELWWVALAFEDESTKPMGMFTDFASAKALGDELAAQWGVPAVVTNVV